MKAKKISQVVGVVCVVVMVVVISFLGGGDKTGVFTAGDGGFSLKEANEKAKVTMIADANQTTEQSLAQVTIIGDYKKSWDGGVYAGGYILGGLSTEFGYTMPFAYTTAGINNKLWNAEYRIGQFKRNYLFASNIDPQFSNFIIVNGQGTAAFGMQTSVCYKPSGTTFVFGNTGGSEFYTLDGAYFATLSQKVGQFNFSGGVELGSETTGFVAGTWANSKNSVFVGGNNLGLGSQNIVANYSRVLSDKMSLSGSVFASNLEQKYHAVLSWLSPRQTRFFASAGIMNTGIVRPYGGVGCSYVF